MKKFYAQKQDNKFIFEGEELTHFNIIRCRVGEEILCLGNGNTDYLCKVTEISKKRAYAEIVKEVENTKNPKVNITVFQAFVKGEKLDLIVQKLTELGISNLVLFESEFAIAKQNNNKQERMEKISKEACKQCGRNIPLIIGESVKFDKMIQMLAGFDTILFANEKNTQRVENVLKNAKNIAIIVGSEGGFSDSEIKLILDAGACNFGLGERILRAETACIALASIVGYLTGV